MIPSADTTCLFEFISKFDAINGVYRIIAETTFANSVASGVDFYTNLYVPSGLSKTDFNTDYESYKKDLVYVLQSVTDDTVVYYVPGSIIGKIPDPTIREYFPLVMAVDLGVQKNTQMILPLIDLIKDLVTASLGSENPVRIMTDPNKKLYLTDGQYAVLEAARNANKEVLVPLSVQLKQEQDKNTVLAAKVAAYEELIRTLGIAPN
jgi:hypothetical protein